MSVFFLWQRSEQDTETAEAFNPHLSYVYKDRSVIEDASSLILHHMKRQAGEWGDMLHRIGVLFIFREFSLVLSKKIVDVFVAIHKDDKHKIKLLLRQLIPDLFFSPRQEMSDDEDEG